MKSDVEKELSAAIAVADKRITTRSVLIVGTTLVLAGLSAFRLITALTK